MSLVISSVFTYDTDAGNYIQAVETADGQALESATRKAINDFVIGCKQDGIWDAIKASCILAGARTLNGALVSLVGTAPTNYNFVAEDYNRKTGLVGNRTTKYLDSNRNNNADPQNSKHLSTFVSSNVSAGGVFLSTISLNVSGDSYIYQNPSAPEVFSRINQGAADTSPIRQLASGFCGVSRSSASFYSERVNKSNYDNSFSSAVPLNQNLFIYGYPGSYLMANARLAFYSIGESLDLAKLDGRVTDLINKFSEVIP